MVGIVSKRLAIFATLDLLLLLNACVCPCKKDRSGVFSEIAVVGFTGGFSFVDYPCVWVVVGTISAFPLGVQASLRTCVSNTP